MTIRNCKILIWAMFVLVCMPRFLSAQQVILGVQAAGADQTKMYKTALDREMKLLRESQEQRLTTCIEDLKRVCELSDGQVTKLQVAAKGALERSMEKTRKQYSDMLRQFGMINDVVEADAGEGGDGQAAVADGSDGNQGEGEGDADGNEWLMAGGIDLGFIRANIEATGELATPEAERVWKTAVSKTLTEPQAATYAGTMAARAARCRKAAVEAFVARVDVELLLQDSQREELFNLIDDKYGEALRKDIVRNSLGNFSQPGFPLKSRINNDFQKLFSDSQYHVWTTKFAGELEHIEMSNGQRNGNNAGLWGLFFGN